MPGLNMKKEIARVCMELVKQKNIDQITVQEAADRCGISRQAFYYHFEDILAVHEWNLKTILTETLEKLHS